MSKALPTRALATTLLALVSVAAQAQAQNDHAAHGQADAQTAAPSTQTVAPAADPHAGHATSASGSTAAPAMDHGNMQMQGGSAPPDARDPHGYSNGLTLGSGDYAVPGVPRLMLADEHRFFSLRGETLERRFTRKGDDSTAYDLQAWYGTTYNKAVVKAEGDIAKGKLEESRTELLWGTPSHRTGTPSSAFGWITGKARAVNGWLSASRASPLLVRAGGDGLRGKWWTYGAACRRQLRAAADPATDSGASRRVAVLWQGRPGTRYRQGPGRSVCWLAPAL